MLFFYESADGKSNTAQLHTCVVSADFAFALQSPGTLKVEKTRESRGVYNIKPKPLKGKQFPVFHAPDSKWSNPIIGLWSME